MEEQNHFKKGFWFLFHRCPKKILRLDLTSKNTWSLDIAVKLNSFAFCMFSVKGHIHSSNFNDASLKVIWIFALFAWWYSSKRKSKTYFEMVINVVWIPIYKIWFTLSHFCVSLKFQMEKYPKNGLLLADVVCSWYCSWALLFDPKEDAFYKCWICITMVSLNGISWLKCLFQCVMKIGHAFYCFENLRQSETQTDDFDLFHVRDEVNISNIVCILEEFNINISKLYKGSVV